tara:strand:+ start:333 stop:542 length:210 start_codon:yes stop_codon:yes gene_type:complete
MHYNRDYNIFNKPIIAAVGSFSSVLLYSCAFSTQIHSLRHYTGINANSAKICGLVAGIGTYILLKNKIE